MARKTAYGKHTLSASEIGSYTVCPEAWRLSAIENVKIQHTKKAEQGDKLHQEWAQSYDEAIYLNHHFKLIILLILLTVLAFILTQ